MYIHTTQGSILQQHISLGKESKCAVLWRKLCARPHAGCWPLTAALWPAALPLMLDDGGRQHGIRAPLQIFETCGARSIIAFELHDPILLSL